ncbi:TPA: CDP-glycerol glycerophosphotransferase family protein [Streptococcus suis]|nr:CDP-glycerol glycerophosphotransferase family protein [Streptococcus suis]
MKQIIDLVRRFISKTFLIMFRVFPVNDKKVVFSSYFSTKFNDSPRAIFESMRVFAPDFQFIWLMRDDSIQIEGATVLKPTKLKALFHLATAKIWVDSSRKRSWVVKRKNQYYVQTWHGGIAFKRVEADVADKLPDLYVKSAKQDSKMADLFISGSKWQTQSYRKSYWYDGEILEKGIPRSDIFYKSNDNLKNLVYQHYQLKADTKLVLYAPTFRADESMSNYDIEFDTLLDSLSKKFGGDWAVLVRLHPNVAKKQDFIQYTDRVLNGSSYQEINDLIISSEILITDYSSCMFDAMEAGKIVFMYTKDLEAYMADRGSEFEFDELPFAIAQSNEDLFRMLEEFDKDSYDSRVSVFTDSLGLFNSSHASEDVVNYILEMVR